MLRRFSLPLFATLAVILTLGGLAAWGTLAVWCVLIQQQASSGNQVFEYLLVGQDGKPFIQRYTGTNYAERELRDLEGVAISFDEGQRVLQGAQLSPPPPRQFSANLGMTWGRLLAFNDGRQRPVYWYFVHESGRDSAIFQGFDSKSKLPVGYIGVSGFSPQRPPDSERFPVDNRNLGVVTAKYIPSEQPEYSLGVSGPGQIPSWKVYLISGRRLLEIDLQEHSVRELLTADGMLGVAIVERGAATTGATGNESKSTGQQHLVVRTADSLMIVSPDDGRQTPYSIPPDLRGELLSVYEVAGDRLLAISARKSGQGDAMNQLAWLDASGEESKRREVRLQMGGADRLPDQALIAGLIPSPLALSLVSVVVGPLSLVDSGFEPDYRTAVVHQLRDWWLYLLPVSLLSAALAVLTYRRQRQMSLPRPVFWAVFVFLVGPLGFVAYLAHRAWPVRKPCPNCEQPTPQDRDRCTECSAPFPLPKRQGTEVFA